MSYSNQFASDIYIKKTVKISIYFSQTIDQLESNFVEMLFGKSATF